MVHVRIGYVAARGCRSDLDNLTAVRAVCAGFESCYPHGQLPQPTPF